MKDDMRKAFVFALAVILSMGVAGGAAIWTLYEHEQAHYQIYKYYGYDSETTVGVTDELIILGNTTSLEPVSDKDRHMIRLAHSINESVGYNLHPFLTVIVFFLSLLTFYHIFEDISR